MTVRTYKPKHTSTQLVRIACFTIRFFPPDIRQTDGQDSPNETKPNEPGDTEKEAALVCMMRAES